jgi:hypothetical protein
VVTSAQSEKGKALQSEMCSHTPSHTLSPPIQAIKDRPCRVRRVPTLSPPIQAIKDRPCRVRRVPTLSPPIQAIKAAGQSAPGSRRVMPERVASAMKPSVFYGVQTKEQLARLHKLNPKLHAAFLNLEREESGKVSGKSLKAVCVPCSCSPSLIPTVNGNTVRSFSTHGQLSAAQGSSTTVSRSDIRLIQHLDSSGSWFGPEVALNWLFPYPLTTH